ncbi:MAG: hypothetical protein SF052_13000 [Bacteroidia bacterium]|nr:hypothetical protein [Bacteroidia bacterium]
MKALIIILLAIAAFMGFLYFRHLWVKLGFKDNNYGGVQNMPRLAEAKNHEEAFLPGSRSGQDDSLEKIAKVMAEGLEIQKLTKRKKQRPRLFTSKKDFQRAYIIDALLEKPKF